jgi:uracil-DNA glycosylase
VTMTFDPEALIALVDEALTEQVPSACVPLLPYETRLLERVIAALAKQVKLNIITQGTFKAVLREVRDEAIESGQVTLPGFQRVVNACTRCPGLRHPPYPTLGNIENPELLVITENLPTLRLDMLWHGFETAGIIRHRIAVTGATRCSGPVTSEDFGRCSEHLITEIEVLKPELIVTLGGPAAQVLLHTKAKVSELRGKVWWLGPWAVLPTFSLGYADRGGRAEGDLKIDLALAKRFLDG